MVSLFTDRKETAFYGSIDLLGDSVSTGISASDRAKTILALMDEKKPKISWPTRYGHGHFPSCKTGGVQNFGHTRSCDWFNQN